LIRKRVSVDFGSCGGCCRVPACAFDRFSCAFIAFCLFGVVGRTLNPICKSIQPHCAADLHSLSAPMIEPLCFFVALVRSNPSAAFSIAALPTSRYAHRPRFRKIMRPTGEASRPVSGEFVCRLCEVGSSSSALRRTSQSINSGVLGDATVTGRFRDRKLVVSVE
jgi:hypothetical protein